MTEPIGFVGLGRMGHAMTGNLTRAGHRVIGFDISPDTARRTAEAHGLDLADSVAGVLNAAGIVILMLPNGRIVSETIEAAKTSLREGQLLIDMSSSAPVGTRELGERLAAAGVGLLDAPVSGGVARAEKGTLAIIVGGEAALAERARPILETMGSSLIHVGALGAGHAMKALNNYVSAAGLVAACEAVAVAQEFGIDGDTAIEVLNNSSGRNNATENKLRQFVLSGSFGSGFSLGLMRKDLATAIELAGLMQVGTDLTGPVLKLWERAETELGGQADHTEIAKMVRRPS